MSAENPHCGCGQEVQAWQYPYLNPGSNQIAGQNFVNEPPAIFAVIEQTAPGQVGVYHQDVFFEPVWGQGWEKPGQITQVANLGALPLTDQQYQLPLVTGYKGSCM